MTRVSMESVSKYFDGGETVANYRLNLEIEDGEFVVFLGPSGCGKTTALRLIAGLETPSEGAIYFDDERVDGWSPSARNVAMVFQNYALYPHMSVWENIEYPLKVRGFEPDERDRRIEDVVSLLHIEEQVNKPPSDLSGGQRQRVSLARAIVREPSVFLLDEPLSNLDAKLRQEMRIELKRLQDELDVTTIYVTHNQEEAMSMADRVVVMNRGTIRQIAPPGELYDRPRTAWVARFIGSPPMNLLEGVRTDGAIDFGDAGTVHVDAIDADRSAAVADSESSPTPEPQATEASGAVVAGGGEPGTGTGSSGDATEEMEVVPAAKSTSGGANAVLLGVRPEDFSLSTDPPPSGNAIVGEVDTIEPLGEYTLVNVAANDQLVNVKVADTRLQRDDRVSLTFEDSDAYLYDANGELVA
ncbi:ATPase component of ABC-type sugar transporter [Halovivax ruber XH-70]|uniref:ABC-type D-xylose/L-arabinose transporter n=2 Tax=Halovivax ruber TaxID=387341 RepID=L0IDY7_HALRX|nr:ATPase component of ABC-type sugar transporter [Halovivax ruber XH-70]